MIKTAFNRFLAMVLLLALMLTMVSVACFSASAASDTVVTTEAVRLRSTPEIASDNYILTLGVGEELTLIADSSQGWANVARGDGTQGYCSVDYLDVPLDSGVTFTGVTTDDVNFRSGASTDYSSYGMLSAGTAFVVIDNSNELWVKVECDGTQGYIYRSYTSLVLSLNKVFGSDATTPAEQTTSAVETTPLGTWGTEPDETGDSNDITEPTVNSEPAEPTVSAESTEPAADVPNRVNTPNWYSSSLLDNATNSSSINSKVSLINDFILSHSQITVCAGDTYNLAVYMTNATVENSVSYTSSDKSVARVSSGGIVRGISDGTAIITASLNGKEQYCTVNVEGVFTPSTTPTTANTEPTGSEVATTTAAEPDSTAPSSTSATEPITVPNTFELSASSASMEVGNLFVLTSPVEADAWSSSDTSVATVSDGIVTALKVGRTTITATSGNLTGTCQLVVTKTTTDNTIKYTTVEIPVGKTFYNGATSAAEISWSSSDTSVATVSNGFITAEGKGTAVVTATSSKGTKTCLVTATNAEPVRFTYAYPNTAAIGETVNLVAVTDSSRTAVQFKISVNGTTKTIDATQKADGNTLVWTGTTTLDTSGTFNVTAYSKKGSKYSTCNDAKTTVFIRENEDLLKETKESRRASDELIKLLADFEGYSGNVYFDNIAGGIPTLGYGKVVYIGDSFYNDMTKKEAYALLVDTVNNGGYANSVNSYLQELDANYNQQQFDALVSFAYNIGSYGLKSDSEIRALILESVEKSADNENSDETAAYVNGTQVNLRSGPATSYDSIGWVSYPDTLTLLETKLLEDNWYYVKTADGREGYIYKDYVTLGVPTSDGEIYLSLIDKAEFSRVILEYHHAGGSCISGLLYRRVDELDIFYYGDYVRNGSSNVFGYSFTCNVNKSTKL